MGFRGSRLAKVLKVIWIIAVVLAIFWMGVLAWFVWELHLTFGNRGDRSQSQFQPGVRCVSLTAMPASRSQKPFQNSRECPLHGLVLSCKLTMPDGKCRRTDVTRIGRCDPEVTTLGSFSDFLFACSPRSTLYFHTVPDTQNREEDLSMFKWMKKKEKEEEKRVRTVEEVEEIKRRKRIKLSLVGQQGALNREIAHGGCPTARGKIYITSIFQKNGKLAVGPPRLALRCMIRGHLNMKDMKNRRAPRYEAKLGEADIRKYCNNPNFKTECPAHRRLLEETDSLIVKRETDGLAIHGEKDD